MQARCGGVGCGSDGNRANVSFTGQLGSARGRHAAGTCTLGCVWHALKAWSRDPTGRSAARGTQISCDQAARMRHAFATPWPASRPGAQRHVNLQRTTATAKVCSAQTHELASALGGPSSAAAGRARRACTELAMHRAPAAFTRAVELRCTPAFTAVSTAACSRPCRCAPGRNGSGRNTAPGRIRARVADAHDVRADTERFRCDPPAPHHRASEAAQRECAHRVHAGGCLRAPLLSGGAP